MGEHEIFLPTLELISKKNLLIARANLHFPAINEHNIVI